MDKMRHPRRLLFKAAGAQTDSGGRTFKNYKAFSIRWNDEVGMSEVTEVADEGQNGGNHYDDYDDNLDSEGWYANFTHVPFKGKGGFGKGYGKGKGGFVKGKGVKGGACGNPFSGGKS